MKTTVLVTYEKIAVDRNAWLVEVTTDRGSYAETAIFECSTSAFAETLASFIRYSDIHIWNVVDSDH
jgi:hypothetical protein